MANYVKELVNDYQTKIHQKECLYHLLVERL